MKSPSRTWDGQGKSVSERKRRLWSNRHSLPQFRLGKLLQVNDSEATIHMKGPSHCFGDAWLGSKGGEFLGEVTLLVMRVKH